MCRETRSSSGHVLVLLLLCLLSYGFFTHVCACKPEPETPDWRMTLKTIRNGIHKIDTYLNAALDLFGGDDGLCHYKCSDGYKPVPRPGYKNPPPNGCGSPLFGIQVWEAQARTFTSSPQLAKMNGSYFRSIDIWRVSNLSSRAKEEALRQGSFIYIAHFIRRGNSMCFLGLKRFLKYLELFEYKKASSHILCLEDSFNSYLINSWLCNCPGSCFTRTEISDTYMWQGG
uniref:Phospholipase A2, group XIIA n=1 Tax=Nothobranchius furzeri TaxID=105023 RepID=A0A8C6KQ62_NOTFU